MKVLSAVNLSLLSLYSISLVCCAFIFIVSRKSSIAGKNQSSDKMLLLNSGGLGDQS